MLTYSDSTGQLVLRDPSVGGNPIVTDTTDRGMLFTPPANVWTGTISIPSRSATSEGADGPQGLIDTEGEYFIGTPNLASANIVRGLIRYGDDAANLWRDAKGTHRRDEDAVGNTFIPQTDLVTKNFLATMRAYTPMINGLGHLVIRERCVLRPRDPGSPPSITKTVPAFTLSYRLHSDFWYGNPLIVPAPDAVYRALYAIVGQVSFTSNMAAGYAYPGRRLVALIHTRSASAAPSSVTIGGVAATIHDTAVSANTRVSIASAIVPTGENVDVTVTFASAPNRQTLFLYAVRSITGAAPSIQKTTVASGTSAALSVTVGAAQTAIVGSSKLGGAGPPTCVWTNAIEQAETALNTDSGASSASIESGAGTKTVTAAWSSTAGDITLLAAVFG